MDHEEKAAPSTCESTATQTVPTGSIQHSPTEHRSADCSSTPGPGAVRPGRCLSLDSLQGEEEPNVKIYNIDHVEKLDVHILGSNVKSETAETSRTEVTIINAKTIGVFNIVHTDSRPESQEGAYTRNWSLLKPKLAFRSKFRTPDDKCKPCIRTIIPTRDGRLALADSSFNNKVKVVDSAKLKNISSVSLTTRPYRLASLGDGSLAVTAVEKNLHILDISGSDIRHLKHTIMRREYRGVCELPGDPDKLIVCCIIDKEGPASVDVITTDGVRVRNLTDGDKLPGLRKPRYVCIKGNEVLLSDYETETVFIVHVDTGNLIRAITHQEFDMPCQVTFDSNGNVFIAYEDSRCVVLVSADGQRVRLLNAEDHGSKEGPSRHPDGVCFYKETLVVSWFNKDNSSVVTGYDFE